MESHPSRAGWGREREQVHFSSLVLSISCFRFLRSFLFVCCPSQPVVKGCSSHPRIGSDYYYIIKPAVVQIITIGRSQKLMQQQPDEDGRRIVIIGSRTTTGNWLLLRYVVYIYTK